MLQGIGASKTFNPGRTRRKRLAVFCFCGRYGRSHHQRHQGTPGHPCVILPAGTDDGNGEHDLRCKLVPRQTIRKTVRRQESQGFCRTSSRSGSAWPLPIPCNGTRPILFGAFGSAAWRWGTSRSYQSSAAARSSEPPSSCIRISRRSTAFQPSSVESHSARFPGFLFLPFRCLSRPPFRVSAVVLPA